VVTLPPLPACYDVEIAHRRRSPVEHRLRHSMTTWLVDVDDVPQHRGVRFLAADHFGTGGTIRDNIDRFVLRGGLDRPARVLMLCQPRVYGYVFNPLTIFYCLDKQGELTHVVAEVRNTYGGRHLYLMKADDLHTSKEFYVSPFYPVDGQYTMRLPLPSDRLVVAVTLLRDGEPPFVATMTGRVRPDARLQEALHRPWENRGVMAGIKRHGVALYLKGLRPFPRPEGDRDDQHQHADDPVSH
jgi:uncharacterized protein